MSDPRANRRGILALTASMAIFCINDVMMKLVGGVAPIGEVIFVRGIIMIAFVTALLVVLGQWRAIGQAARSPWIAARSLMDAGAAASFVVGIVNVALGELTAVFLVAPLLLTGLAVVFEKEQVGWRRWTAVCVGLVGTLFIVKPQVGAINLFALLGVVAALTSALRDLTTRRIPSQVPTLVITWFGAIAVMLAGAVLGLWETWRMLAMREVGLLAFAAAALTLGTYLLILAFRGVEISVVSPFRYTLLIWASLAGFVVFGEVPDAWSAFGATLIAGGGLYALHREAVRQRLINGKREDAKTVP